MNAQEIRRKYLEYFINLNHKQLERERLVPKEDPTTLFTGSGMQPLIPYLLGQEHPLGNRLVDSQTCLRSQDIDEVGDGRHTTFFEMLGNWSLGDYFKKEQINFVFNFLVNEIKLPIDRLYVSCFYGYQAYNIPKDTFSADIWQGLFSAQGLKVVPKDMVNEDQAAKLGMDSTNRILFYQAKNWWCRNGQIDQMPVNEPGGPDTEVFYEFPFIEHDPKFGEHCHVNCDCGRFIEIGNSVFMEYIKTKTGFKKLPKQNVDFGGGLERLAQASIDSPDIDKISLILPIIEELEQLSHKDYASYKLAMAIIADHFRAACFLVLDNVIPSNKSQGYVLRRLIRRAVRQAFSLGIEQNFSAKIITKIIEIYQPDYSEFSQKQSMIIDVIEHEEKIFRQTLRKGLKELDKLTAKKLELTGQDIFLLYDTYGFPTELLIEEIGLRDLKLADNWQADFETQMAVQRQKSQTAAKGVFKGGLADHSQITTKYHTATHIMYRALVNILGPAVVQRGSNITAERLRFDFSYGQKLTTDQIKQIEALVNSIIEADLEVSFKEEDTQQALKSGVLGAFGDRYAERVKVYTIGDPNGKYYSREICGGPHVEHTGQLAEGGKHFKIIEEKSSAAGVRRIKAILE